MPSLGYSMLRCLARTIRNAVFRAWYGLNIEHKGAYSFERLRRLHQFINLQHPSTFLNVVVAIATPLPCFLIAIGSDALPLNRPDKGPQANGMFWVRSWLIMTVFTVAVLIPLHHPDITSIPNRRVWLVPMSIVIGAIHTGFHYLAALTIGFPVPFSNLTLNVLWISLIIGGIMIYMGPRCRGSSLIRQQLKIHAIYTYGASNLAVVYPLFYYAFLCVKDIEAAQLLMAFSLPILKTMEKHLLYHVTRHAPDLQPVMLVFNVEVFNALFVSSCMRNSTSPSVTISLMVADFLGACAALYGLRNIMTRLDQFVLKMGLVSTRVDILDIATFIANQQHPDTQQLTRNEPPISAVKIAWGKHRQSWKESSVVPTEGTLISSFNQSPSVEQIRAASVLAKHVQELTLKERLEFVHETCRVLRRVEFLLLVEYTEVMVPMTYALYIAIVYHLPNRKYFPYLQEMSEDDLTQTVRSVLVYVLLQLLSFVVLLIVLSRRFLLAPGTILRFVLTTEWRQVQSLLVLWIIYVLQSSIQHVGTDYTFKFEWLHHNPVKI